MVRFGGEPGRLKRGSLGVNDWYTKVKAQTRKDLKSLGHIALMLFGGLVTFVYFLGFAHQEDWLQSPGPPVWKQVAPIAAITVAAFLFTFWQLHLLIENQRRDAPSDDEEKGK